MGDFVILTGMVLSSMPIGEYDRRVVLLTRERGKVAAFAKGARRLNSPFMGSTQTFSFGSFQLYEGRNTYNLKQADITSYFSEITVDLEMTCYAYYFAEVADYFSRENLESTELLHLLFSTFKALNNSHIPNELIRCIYELKAIVLAGEYPDVFACCGCGSEEFLSYFSFNDMGIYCKNCGKNRNDGIMLSGSCIYTLQYIISSKIEKLFSFTVTQEVLVQLEKVMSAICARIFDRPMKSLAMLEGKI